MTWKQKIEDSRVPCELFFHSTETRNVQFRDNKLTNIELKENDAVACRIIDKNRLGMSTGSGNVSFERLHKAAIDNTQFGKKVDFSFPQGPGI